VPPGIADAVTPNPLFSFTPSATVDEGNNWINVSWGPLTLTNPSCGGSSGSTPICGTAGTDFGGGPLLANYNLTAAINNIPANQPHPFTDFYGNLRPEPGESTGGSGRFDPGAIEFGSSMGTASFSVSPVSPFTGAFGAQSIASPSAPQTITVTNTGSLALTGGTFTITGSTTFTGGGCPATLAVGASCTYAVVFRPTAVTSYTASVAFAYSATIGTTTVSATGTGTPVSLSGNGVAAGPLAFTAATNGTLATVGGARVLTFNVTRGQPITSVVTITNNGTTATAPTAVTINGITAAGQGPGSGLFTLTGNTCPATLPPGGITTPAANCTISITYNTPVAAPPPPARAVMGTAAVANNGSGTVAGSSNLALVGR
jgi:hypothetical protein